MPEVKCIYTVFNNYLIKKQFDLPTGIMSTMATVMEKSFQTCRYR